MSSPPSASASDDGPKFLRIEHSSGGGVQRHTSAKFSVSNAERNVESLAAINLNTNNNSSGGSSVAKRKDSAKKGNSLKRGIFGGIFRKKTKKMLFGEPVDAHSTTMPPVLASLFSYLENKNTTVGIFRQSASVAEVEAIKKLYESGKEIEWNNYQDPHTVANVLLTYLLRLPEPLLCFDLYDSFIAAEEYVVDEESRLNFLRKLLDTLPQGYRIILERLIGLLSLVAQRANENKMTANNLAIVFGPALMRRKVENVKQVVQDSPVIIRIVRVLIEDFAFFFKNGERSEKKEESYTPRKVLPSHSIDLGSATPPFPDLLRAHVDKVRTELNEELNETQELLLRSPTAPVKQLEEEPAEMAATKKPISVVISEPKVDPVVNAQQEKFKALQNMVSSAFINIKHQVTYLSIQLEERLQTMEEVTACCHLVKCLKQIINSQPGTVNTATMTMPKVTRAKALSKTPEIEEKIQSFHQKLKKSFVEIQTSFKNLETQLYEDTLFMEDHESIDLAIKLGVVARDIKKLLDAFEDSVSQSPSDGSSLETMIESENASIEQTAKNTELRIRSQLGEIKKELNSVKSLDEAVCLARVIRTIKKSLLDPDGTADLKETITRPPRAATSLLLPADKSKIETISEVVGYGLHEIETELSSLDLNIYVKTQLLQQIEEFLQRFLSQEASTTISELDSNFELALEAALARDAELSARGSRKDSLTDGVREALRQSTPRSETEPSSNGESVKEDKKEVIEIIQKENHYVVFTDHENEIEEDKDQEEFERSKEYAVSAIFQLQATINNLQIELEGKKDYLSISALAAVATELKKLLEEKAYEPNIESTIRRLTSVSRSRGISDVDLDDKIEVMKSVALGLFDESRGMLSTLTTQANNAKSKPEAIELAKTILTVLDKVNQVHEATAEHSDLSGSLSGRSPLSNSLYQNSGKTL
eukprot:TRINITY_DN1325_c0_g1_i1.p1 TRINITY_DN1325_c0_g1~~TRINITY_DN1325_c0_g1_i1.p1  ORF type:complete len:937 (-),score=215.34 TRINITY_DN1325_c0_g1_i1:57-2867(-)